MGLLRTQHAQDFLRGGYSQIHFAACVIDQQLVARLARCTIDFHDAGAAGDQMAQRLIRNEYFVQPGAAAVAAAMAMFASLATEQLQRSWGEAMAEHGQ